MKVYLDKITLNKNKRGCYIIDTVKGCSILKYKDRGCYDSCYANNIANRYGFKFSKPIIRNFYKDNEPLLFKLYPYKDMDNIIKKLKIIKPKFIRIGEMGDPSEDWQHTINICNIISAADVPIVISTKHLKTIPNKLLNKIKELNLCINTSISAMDSTIEIKHRINQYNKLKNYCKSVLRIVSCDYNKGNKEGLLKSKIQNELFNNEKVIDTIFRPGINNYWVLNNIINVKKVKFLNSFVLVSQYNEKTYFGPCEYCPEQCGINL